jgi:transposase-like protein
MSKRRLNRSVSEWELLIKEYEARSVSCAYFCELHEVNKNQVYKWRRHFLSKKQSITEESAFIALAINREQESDQQNISNITSAIKISSSSGVVVEFISGCKYLELKAIMEILDAAK